MSGFLALRLKFQVMRQTSWQQKVNNQNLYCVPYLVVHPEANNLGQEGPCKASSDQLFVGPTQRRLIQALPYDTTRKLIHLQTQVGWAFSVWVHLENEDECFVLVFFNCGQKEILNVVYVVIKNIIRGPGCCRWSGWTAGWRCQRASYKSTQTTPCEAHPSPEL